MSRAGSDADQPRFVAGDAEDLLPCVLREDHFHHGLACFQWLRGGLGVDLPRLPYPVAQRGRNIQMERGLRPGGDVDFERQLVTEI